MKELVLEIFANTRGVNNIVSLAIVSPLCSNLSLHYAENDVLISTTVFILSDFTLVRVFINQHKGFSVLE